MIDYTRRRRIKIWGHVKIVHESEQPALIAQLESPAYRARIERAIVITVEAVEWNCPQHITPRFTGQEIQNLMADMQEENRQLKELVQQQQSQVKALKSGLTST
jgi:hypothetical protein